MQLANSHLLPVPVPHPWVAQTLNQRNVWFEVLNLVLDLLRNILERRDVLEVLDTLVDGLEGSIYIGPAVMEQRWRGVGERAQMCVLRRVLANCKWFEE